MSDSFITIVLVLITSILVFMVPVVSVAHRNDITATNTVQTAVTEFVDKIRMSGSIKQADYDSLLEILETTGNVYDVRVNVHYIDENPAKKTSSDVSDTIKIGENVYYVEYTKQIEDEFKKTDDGVIKLEAGDYVKVDVENSNQTLYQSLKKTLYNISGGAVGEIGGIHVALVLETTDGEQAGISGLPVQTFSITYNANGGEQSTCPTEQIKNKNEKITLSRVKPSWPGTNKKFVGWSENSNAMVADYVSGGVFLKDKDTVLYAVWAERTYSVVYMPNISQAINELPKQDDGLVQGDSYIIWEGQGTPTATGATFIGWNTLPDGTGTTYSSGDTITISDSLILYAIWGT